MSNSSRKCVAIIGAGVSGLVSAVNMLKVNIEPIVFDKESNIGGMWNADIKPCWKSMRTNISKFSTTLSDLSWSNDSPIFPNQAQVYEYLKNYTEKFLSNENFRFNTQILNINYLDEKWIVEYRTKFNKILSEQFDFVIVASGFFNIPHIPKNLNDFSSFQGKTLHSSDYHSIEQVRNKRVIIVGASMSAAEIAADAAKVAQQVLHIVTRNFWSVPRFIPLKSNETVSCFLPIDLVFYRRSTRKFDNEILFRTNDQYKNLNEYFRLITGNIQQSSKLFYVNDEMPPFIVISDLYAESNRAGKIILQEGRLNNIENDGTLILNNGTKIQTTSNDVLILCTGFRPSLDFFSEKILQDLSYFPDDIFSPLILHRTIFHPTLPNLAFIGMYRGPFWSIIELQSRWVASIFSGNLQIPSLNSQKLGLEIEQQIRSQQPRPQFPHGDYVGLMDDLMKEIFSGKLLITNDIAIPTEYRTDGPDKTIIDEINSLCEQAHNGRFIAGAVFRSFHQSKWTFERTLTGKPADGFVNGKAEFSFSQENQLIYKEQGKLHLSSQFPLDVTQKYIYEYDENNDCLTVYFVNDENKRGSLFHTLKFQSKESSQIGWIAHGEHLCSQDHYSAEYLFLFNGINLTQFQIKYTVKGPAKDYVSKTIFKPEI